MRVLKNWLSVYVDYLKETESPQRFKTWAGISAIAATLKRNVWIDRIDFKLYPHMYIILVGPPSCGKGTSIHPALSILREADTSHIIADRVTAEKVIERLAKGFPVTITTPTGTLQLGYDYSAQIVVPELGVFLNASSWTCEFCCELWDRNEWEYDTKHKGTYKLKDISVNILGGCVPDFIRKLNRSDSTSVISGGFTSRCIFVFETQKGRKIPFPTRNGQNLVKQKLVDDLKEISLIKGEFKFTPAATAAWVTYYDNMKHNEFESDVVIGFKGRIMAHVFKTAMILAISESSTLVIEERHLTEAISLIHQIQDELDVCFRGVGESQLVVAQDRIMRYCEHKGITTRKEILRDNMRHITDEDLTRVLSVLEATGILIRADQGTRIVYTYAGQPTIQNQTQSQGAGNP